MLDTILYYTTISFTISKNKYTDATNDLQCYKTIWAGVQTFESCHLHTCKRGYPKYPVLNRLIVQQKDLFNFRSLLMKKMVNTQQVMVMNRVLLRRKGIRKILNADDVASALHLKHLYLEGRSLKEQISIFYNRLFLF